MADDRLAIDDMLEELRMLRHVVSEVINHCAEGGYVDRRGALFKDLRKVHRATRDRQVELKKIWPELDAAPWYREADPRYWQNLACCMAFFAGDRAWKLEAEWAFVLDSLLEKGGTELTSAARSLAHVLGIELRQSHDGGKNWYPVPAMRGRLEEATDAELQREVEKRVRAGSTHLGLLRPRPVAGEQLVINGRCVVQMNPGVPDDLGIEHFLRVALDHTGGVIAAGPRDYRALEQHARQAQARSTLTFAGNPMRESDAVLNHEGLVYDDGERMCAFVYYGGGRCNRDAEPGSARCSAHASEAFAVHEVLPGPGRATRCGRENRPGLQPAAAVNCTACIRLATQANPASTTPAP